MTEDNKNIGDLESLEKRILSSPYANSVYLASGPVAVKSAIEMSGFLEEAKKENSTLAKELLRICINKGVNPGPEEFLACVAFYTFAHVGLKESTDYLLSYAQQHKIELPTGWASHFATHAFKTLTNQKDTDGRYVFYSTDARQTAIKGALDYLHQVKIS